MSKEFELFVAKAIRNYLRMEAMFAENQCQPKEGAPQPNGRGAFDAESQEIDLAYENLENPKP